MTTSNLLLISALTLSSLQADEVELTHGDLLSGTIDSLSSEGVTIQSKVSPRPLEIESASIRNIIFDHLDATPQEHVELITLSNGDRLPCNVIQLDSDELKISTWYAGDFNIPRQDIHSLQFGLTEDKKIPLGLDSLTGWSTQKGQWTLSPGKGYACRGTGTLARELKLPENLRIQFTLNWKNTPDFVFRFCADNDKLSSKQNAYEFMFNSSGIQLNREVDTRATTKLADIPLKPFDILNQELDVDIRINRELGKITLLLNGVKRGTWIDPLDTANGNYISLNNRAKQGRGCYTGNLSISEWKEASRKETQNKLIQGKKDILIDTEDEHYQGRITSISKATPNNRTILFGIEHTKSPLKVPDRRISALIFAKLGDDRPSNNHYTAQLVGGGTIQLTEPKLTHGKISFTHSVLGACTLDTTIISRIITQPISSQ